MFILPLFLSCDNEFIDDPIPFANFDRIEINLSLPAYSSILRDGGFVGLSQGVRGIILYRENVTSYKAFERNCSFMPNSAGATVEVHSSGLFMRDPSCASTFAFAGGIPTGGPAISALREYKTTLNGNMLTITDESVLGN